MAFQSQIKDILIDQREDIPAILKRCGVERSIERDVRASLADDLIKVVSGVRRSGKSSLAHRVLKGLPYGYANFDDERFAGLRAEDLNGVLEAMLRLDHSIKYVLLDEIQNVEKWELFAARLQRGGYKVLITGSNAHLLSRDLATHLTGRHRVFELYPFSFSEHLRSLGGKLRAGGTAGRAAMAAAFAEYFALGGFPEVRGVVDRRAYLGDLYEKIVTQDIAVRHNVRHLKTLRDVALYTANNFASRISYQNVKNAYSLGSIHTAKNYLAYMQEAYLFFSVEAFSHKLRERVRAPRKIYGVDPALLRAVSVSGQRNEGRLLENLVFLELLRRGRRVTYYCDPRGKYETDFVCHPAEGGGRPELVQVCLDMSTAEVRERELRGLRSALRAFKMKASPIIVTMDGGSPEVVDGVEVKVMPAWEWLAGGE